MFSWAIAEAEEQKEDLFNALLSKLSSLKPGVLIDVIVGTEKFQYDFGTSVDIRFKTSEECYPVLMGILSVPNPEYDPVNPDKRPKYIPEDITFFLPSYYSLQHNDKIEKETIYSTLKDFGIPIKSVEPAGVVTLNFFCSSEKIEFFKTDFSEDNLVYMILPHDEDRIQALSYSLDLLAKTEWSGDSLQIHIGPRTRDTFPGIGVVPPIGTTGTTGKDTLFPPIDTTGSTGHSGK
jgi:hypothetical protein